MGVRSSCTFRLLQHVSGSSAAGIYGGVNRWIQPMVLAISAFASAAAPFVAAEADLRALRQQALRASWILATAIALSIGCDRCWRHGS